MDDGKGKRRASGRNRTCKNKGGKNWKWDQAGSLQEDGIFSNGVNDRKRTTAQRGEKFRPVREWGADERKKTSDPRVKNPEHEGGTRKLSNEDEPH